MPEILEVVRGLGAPGTPESVGIDACSPGEVIRALECGWQPGRDQLHRHERLRARPRRPARARDPPEPRRDQPDRALRPARAGHARSGSGSTRGPAPATARSSSTADHDRPSSGSTLSGSTTHSPPSRATTYGRHDPFPRRVGLAGRRPGRLRAGARPRPSRRSRSARRRPSDHGGQRRGRARRAGPGGRARRSTSMPTPPSLRAISVRSA